MKAIDCAAYITTRAMRSDLTLPQIAVLYCVAAGVDTAEGMENMFGLQKTAVKTTLKKLREFGLVYLDNVHTQAYVLAPDGKDFVRRMLSFIK